MLQVFLHANLLPFAMVQSKSCYTAWLWLSIVAEGKLCAGEVTLTGRVLPIGGIKEKALAARRSDVKTLLFPQGNKKDWDELKGVHCLKTCPFVSSMSKRGSACS